MDLKGANTCLPPKPYKSRRILELPLYFPASYPSAESKQLSATKQLLKLRFFCFKPFFLHPHPAEKVARKVQQEEEVQL